MLIQPNQLKRIFSLLRETGETAWRDEYIGLSSNRVITSTKDLTVDEAKVMIGLLLSVKAGTAPRFNPFPVGYMTKPSKAEENKLRRKILAICHNLGWYIRDENNILVLDKNDKPKLDFNRIDQYCLTHSKYKKKLNDHTTSELTGKAGLVWLFETLKNNTIHKESKPWKKN
jgi:hypothetical protein